MPLLHIVFEAAWALSIIPHNSQSTFFAMVLFDPEKNIGAVIAATIGASIGLVINWFIGKVIGNYLLAQQDSEGFKRMMPRVQRYGWLLLLLVWAPLGNFLMVAAGAFGIRLNCALLLGSLTMLAYYVFQSLKVII